MVHAWGGYEKYAWGYDELCPLNQKGELEFHCWVVSTPCRACDS